MGSNGRVKDADSARYTMLANRRAAE